MEIFEVSVLGAGYIGLVTAACLAALGHRVRIFDPDPGRLEAIRDGRAPFFEAGLDEAVARGRASGLLAAHSSPADALAGADLVMICTGTPITADGESDVSQVATACRMVAEHAPAASVVIRSTLPLGASQELAGWLDRPSFETIATNPEFLRQGTALADFRTPDRIVFGTSDGQPNTVVEMLTSLYQSFPGERLVTNFTTAEMIKNASNAFLATRLSLVNELADLCEAYGADVDAVARGVGLDPRIGSAYMRAGIGFGGSCLPKELANLVRLAERKGLTVRALEGAGRSNDLRPIHIADRLERLLGPMRGLRVALLGLAFKAGTDDVRYSPALALARALIAKGATVVAHDPSVPDTATASIRNLVRTSTPEAAIAGSDITAIATEWPEYLRIDWAAMAEVATGAVLYDGRRLLDRRELEDAGWHVLVVGDGALNHVRSPRREAAAPTAGT